jgi:DNA repair exonuclease SbcCD nuclease subunit
VKILSSADWHINLHKKKIPYIWQESRYVQLFKKLAELERGCDVHVIAGDLFDEAPNTDETCLVLSYLNSVTIPTIVIPGNHEATRKGASFWEHFKRDGSITNSLVLLSTEPERIKIGAQTFQTFPYGAVQKDKLPEHVSGDILVTHIRGEVPPHITAEYDFEKLQPWSLVLLGDLHFNHRYKDTNAYYPGSPLNTTFDRDASRQYGVDIFCVDNSGYTKQFVDLDLPKLIRKTIRVGNPMAQDGYNHIVYEVTGSIDELARIEKSQLLDKKMIEKPVSSSALDLSNMSIYEELQVYLSHIKVADIPSVLSEFSSLGVSK